MPVEIKILGDDAGHAIRELRDFSAPFHHPAAIISGPVSAADAEVLAQPVRAAVVAPEQPSPQVVTGNQHDSAGLPWDERIHSSNRAFNADGTWRRRRGVADDRVKAVEAELRNQMATAEPKETATSAPEKAENAASVGQPEAVVGDSPEDQAQDAEDEKSEADAVREERIAKEPEKVLTHDDVRAALGDYVKKFGMDAAQQDGPRILAAVLTGDVNATNDGKPFKVSDVPDDQAVLAKAVAGVREALTKNVFKRGEVA